MATVGLNGWGNRSQFDFRGHPKNAAFFTSPPMILTRRHLCSSLRACSSFKVDPQYALKCGLEIHTQLNTRFKLFSLSPTSFDAVPNSNVSFFDCGLPGTQPKLNPEAVLLALKAAVALDAQVQLHSSFDRKHYFYPDQPLGYQITQYFNPIARGGHLQLSKDLDDIPDITKTIRIEQIQLEQDTGKIHTDSSKDRTRIDYNRSNMPLIELVTLPDFQSTQHVCAFVKKYQALMKHLGVCTGDMETGAMRVDVNLSINGHSRVELKNLRSYSDIRAAIKSEYDRQVTCVEQNIPITQETRGWNGSETILLRSKDETVDYRFFPDSELPPLRLAPLINDEIRATLSDFPDTLLRNFMAEPYNLDLNLAWFLIDNPEIMKYYRDLWLKLGGSHKSHPKIVNNFFFNTYLGSFTKLNIPINLSMLKAPQLAKLIDDLDNDTLSNSMAKSIIMKVHSTAPVTCEELEILIGDFKNGHASSPPIKSICTLIVKENPQVVSKIINGNKNSIMFLVGLAMKKSGGKLNAKIIKGEFENLIDSIG